MNKNMGFLCIRVYLFIGLLFYALLCHIFLTAQQYALLSLL